MMNFNYSTHKYSIIFGWNTIDRLQVEAERLGMKRVVVLTTPEQQAMGESVGKALGKFFVGVFPGAQPHTPFEATNAAAKFLEKGAIDGIVSVGGGSTIGLGKALVRRTDLPHITVPTTYAGSEVTPILGETREGNKETQSDPRLLPKLVIYDVNLSASLPVNIAILSGFNAIAHAVEAVYAQNRNPITSMMASEGIRAIATAMPAIAADQGDQVAREAILYGAWLCGTCLGTVGMSLHHKICHVLGGLYDMPHAQLHTAMLPHALAYNLPEIGEEKSYLVSALGTEDIATKLFELALELGAEMRLSEMGLPEDGLEAVIERTLASPYWNPRKLESNALHDMLRHAFEGKPPRRVY